MNIPARPDAVIIIGVALPETQDSIRGRRTTRIQATEGSARLHMVRRYVVAAGVGPIG